MSDNPYEAETDDQLRRPWFDAAERQASDILHLVVAWFHDEPERVGQVAALDRPGWLARAPRGGRSAFVPHPAPHGESPGAGHRA
jgi:hypothetical protein